MREYGTARTIGEFVAAAGWVIVALGIILLLVAFDTMRSGFGMLTLTPAIGIILGGLLLICQGQLTQAVVDTADNTAELAKSTAELVRLFRNIAARNAGSDSSTQPPSSTNELGQIRA